MASGIDRDNADHIPITFVDSGALVAVLVTDPDVPRAPCRSGLQKLSMITVTVSGREASASMRCGQRPLPRMSRGSTQIVTRPPARGQGRMTTKRSSARPSRAAACLASEKYPHGLSKREYPVDCPKGKYPHGITKRENILMDSPKGKCPHEFTKRTNIHIDCPDQKIIAIILSVVVVL